MQPHFLQVSARKALVRYALIAGLCGLALLVATLPVKAVPLAISGPCTTTCYVNDATGNDVNNGDTPATAKKTVQAGIDAVSAGGTVRVYPGNYVETAAGRTVTSIGGTYQFGIFVSDAKAGITIQGVTAADADITSASGVLANIKTHSTSNFGPSNFFIEGDNVTIAGVKILENLDGQNKTIEVIGDNFTLKNSEIAEFEGSVYLNDFRYNTSTNTSHVQKYSILNNKFSVGVSLDIASGAGFSGPVSGRVIQGNSFDLNNDAYDYPAISFTGSGSGVPWFVYSVGGAIIKNNDFKNGVSQYIRARGTYNNAQFNWADYWNLNTFDKAAIVGPTPPANVRTYSYPNSYGTFTDVRRIGATIQGEVDHGIAGDTVLVKSGTYPEQVVINKNLTVTGAGQATTNIVPPATLADNAPSPAGFHVISLLTVENSATGNVSGFTIKGPFAGTHACADDATGVYVHASATINLTASSIKDVYLLPFPALFGCQAGIGIRIGQYINGDSAITSTPGKATIDGVTVSGYQKGGIVVAEAGSDATIKNSTVTGVGNTAAIAQNGIQVSYGAKADIRNNIVKDNRCDNSTCGPDIVNQSQSAGILLYLQAAGTVVDNNTVSNNDMGIYHYSSTSVTINANLFTANRYAGVVLNQGKATVSNNEITGASNFGVGVVSYKDDTANAEGTLTNNFITGAGVGVKLIDDFTGDTFIPTIVANLNSITGNATFGIENTTPATVDGTKNWWGSPSGPTNPSNPGGTGQKVSANVNFTPWLCDGTDTSTARGFQPNVTLCTGTPPSVACVRPTLSQLSSYQALGDTFGNQNASFPLKNLIDTSNVPNDQTMYGTFWGWTNYPRAVALEINYGSVGRTVTQFQIWQHDPTKSPKVYFQFSQDGVSWYDIPGLNNVNVSTSVGYKNLTVPTITAKRFRAVIENTDFINDVGYWADLLVCGYTPVGPLSGPTANVPHQLKIASVSVSGGNANNVKDGLSYTDWKVDGKPNNANLTVDLGASRTISSLSYFQTNSGVGRSTKIEYWNGSAWVTIPGLGAVNTGDYSNYGNHVINFSGPITTTKIRFTISNPNNEWTLGGYGDVKVFGF